MKILEPTVICSDLFITFFVLPCEVFANMKQVLFLQSLFMKIILEFLKVVFVLIIGKMICNFSHNMEQLLHCLSYEPHPEFACTIPSTNDKLINICTNLVHGVCGDALPDRFHRHLTACLNLEL